MNKVKNKFNVVYSNIENFYVNKIDGNQKLELTAFIFFLILIGLMIFHLNRPTPWVVDDILKGEGVKNLYGVRQWFDHLYHFYFSWGGRVWGELYAYFFLAMPKEIFNYLNTFGYILFLLLIYTNITGRFKISPFLLILINFLLFACLPAFGQDILWISGCANYMWASLIPLVFLDFMRFYYEKETLWFNSISFLIITFILGILAGWSNENVSVSLIIIMIGYMWIYKQSKKNVPQFAYVGTIGLFIGSLLLWLAPGNFVRFAAEKHSKSILHIVKTMIHNATVLFSYESTLLLIVIFITLMIFSKSKNKQLSVLFMVGAFISSIVFGVVGDIHTRVFLGVVVLMSISVGILLEGWEDDLRMKEFKFLITVILFLGTISFNSIARDGIHDYQWRWNQNLKIIETEKMKGNLDIYVNSITPKNKFCATYGLDDIQPKERNDHWLNRGVAHAFGLHTIQSIKINPSR